MGFQTGSKIDPRLGALDYSGYAKAGEIEGQAMADLGSSVAGGIEDYTAMGGQAIGMRSLDSGVDYSRLFGGGQQGATPEEIAAAEEIAARRAQLIGNQ